VTLEQAKYYQEAMAKTKSISVFYHIERSRVVPPTPASLQRKEEWLKEIQRTIESDWRSRIVQVTYRLINPEVEQQRKFFNGPVIDYYTIQSAEILEGEVPRGMHDRYRETILSDVLGYQVELVGRTERRRKSTSDYTDTQQWHDFLETLRETMFEPNGYEFPDSEAFWEMEKKHGYDQAKKISIEGLQRRYAAKMR